jgi:hypothetical protein
MQQIVSRWAPPAGVRDHTGSPIPHDTVFFAPPPPEIGPVRTAHSGVTIHGSALSKPAAKKVIGLFTLFGMVVGGFLGIGFARGHWTGLIIGMVLGGLIIGGLIYRREGRKRDCTYTGARGVARFPYSARNETAPRGEIFLFSDAVEVQTALLGRSMGTNFNFQWKDAGGKTLYKLEGGYYGTGRSPDPESVYHFARAAEAAWSEYLYPSVMADLRRQDSYKFVVNRTIGAKQYAVLGPGFIDVINPNRQFHNLTHEIQSAVLHQGWIIIRRHDARNKAINSLTGEDGIFYLSYRSVSNVRIFLKLLESVVGVACQGYDQL